ncbi:MAG TPA: hypothetical protein VIG62_03050 [Blastocatellia bacterium]|jgi:hypothetical protein
MPAGQFEKDFGYLMPFLEKVAEAAKAMSDPGAREELMRLMADEKSRWSRIRQILAGSGAPDSSSAKESESEPARTEQPAREPFSFTVGSLRRRQ